MEQIAAVNFQNDWVLEVMTETGRIETIDVGALSGPGVWRRVLEKLETLGIEDRNKTLPAWEYQLIGEWRY